MTNEIRITRAIFDRYWQEANAGRLAKLSNGEAERLRSYHWTLLLAARLEEESDRLLTRER